MTPRTCERVRSHRDQEASDLTLVSAAQAGDHHAFTALVQRHDTAMRRLAFRMLGNAHTMDDVLQEAYIKAFRALPTFRDDAQFSSWLYRITYNACIDELRRARRRPVPAVTPPGQESAAPGPERVVTVADEVRTMLAALPIEQRAAVILVDGEGLDHRTAAQALGVAPGTIASRLSRARASLRRSIEEVTE